MQFGSLARMLQADPPPKAVKVNMSRRVPLVGEELIAYEEEQNRLKKEEALKASLIKEEESKACHGPDNNLSDPMIIDADNAHTPLDGKFIHFLTFYCLMSFQVSILFMMPLIHLKSYITCKRT